MEKESLPFKNYKKHHFEICEMTKRLVIFEQPLGHNHTYFLSQFAQSRVTNVAVIPTTESFKMGKSSFIIQ